MKLNGNHHGGHSGGSREHSRREEEYRGGDIYEPEEGVANGASGETRPVQRPDRPGRKPSGGKKRSKGRVIGAVCGAIVAVLALAVIAAEHDHACRERRSRGQRHAGADRGSQRGRASKPR